MPPTLSLHLIRHGLTDWNKTHRCQGQFDSQLNNTGRQQAKDLRPVIDSLSIDSIYCSSSDRTRDTCELASGHLPIEPVFLDELKEIRLGDWEGQLWSELEEKHPEQTENFRTYPHLFDLEGAEDFSQLQTRGVTAIDSIVNAARSNTTPIKNVLVVSHGALLKSILSHHLDQPMNKLWEGTQLHNCAHSIIEIDQQNQRKVVSIAGVGLDKP